MARLLRDSRDAVIVAMPALSHFPRCHAYEAELRNYRAGITTGIRSIQYLGNCPTLYMIDLEKRYFHINNKARRFVSHRE